MYDYILYYITYYIYTCIYVYVYPHLQDMHLNYITVINNSVLYSRTNRPKLNLQLIQ